jgi:hypothetical protein
MTRRANLTIIDAVRDSKLFAPWFRDQSTWAAWFAFLAALFALPMTTGELAIYRERTGRTEPPINRATEAWLACGRRAGKSFVLALCAVFLACFQNYRQFLQPGERATVLILACDRRQARVIFRYVRGLLTGVPMLAAMIERETAESFDLTNGITIEVATASYRTTRGYTLAAALCDEIAFWPSDDSAEPDYAVLDALRPGMATLPGAMLLCASSPYARRGALWDAHRKHFGKNGDPILVWQAPTRAMNPSVPQSIIDDALERDPASASAEWMAQFRSDVESFIAREVIETVVVPGRYELPPVSGTHYFGFVDPSGGSADSMTLSIAHRQGEKGVLDCVREVRPPFSPDAVVEEFAQSLKSFRLSRVVGDRYAGEWPRERFKVHGITYEPTEKTKTQIYTETLPLLNSGRVELLDHPRLNSQLCGLERRVARGGRDSIDHAPGAHDDVANAAAGALVLAAGRPSKAETWAAWARVNIGPPIGTLPQSAAAFAEMRARNGFSI